MNILNVLFFQGESVSYFYENLDRISELVSIFAAKNYCVVKHSSRNISFQNWTVIFRFSRFTCKHKVLLSICEILWKRSSSNCPWATTKSVLCFCLSCIMDSRARVNKNVYAIVELCQRHQPVVCPTYTVGIIENNDAALCFQVTYFPLLTFFRGRPQISLIFCSTGQSHAI